MTQRGQHGFAQNEPLIVLAVFLVLCLALGLVLGAALRWLWLWRVAG